MNATREIDFLDIVKRSITITWNHKLLWFFGFFAASGGGGGNMFNAGERGGEGITDFFLSHIEVLIAVVLFMVLLWLVFFVMNIISKGALISCITRAVRGEGVRFEDGWHAGFRAFWGVLGIAVTGVLAFLLVSVVCVFAVVLPLAGGAPGIAIAILIGAILFIPYLAFLFLLAFTITYAEREYVLVGCGVADALQAGWNLTRTHLGKSLIMWLVSLLSGIAYVIALIIALMAVALPFILIGMASPVVALVLGIPIALVMIIVSAAAVTTYSYSLWTLLYIELKGGEAAVPAAAGAAGPEPGGFVSSGAAEPETPTPPVWERPTPPSTMEEGSAPDE